MPADAVTAVRDLALLAIAGSLTTFLAFMGLRWYFFGR